MRRSYQKPTFYLEEFEPNVAVSECTRLEAGTVEKYGPQTVTCLAKGQDVIFASGQTGCDHAVVLNGTGTNYMFINYNDSNNDPGDGLYFCWIGPRGTATQEGINRVNEVLQSAGYSSYTDETGDNGTFNIPNGNYGWHVGRANSTIEQLYSHS